MEEITSAELEDVLEDNQVESSNIFAVGYDADDRTLYVQFEDGKGNPGAVYKYLDVPLEVYTQFFSAASKGKYFHKYVKDKYTYKKL
jgi:hypothetical protein